MVDENAAEIGMSDASESPPTPDEVFAATAVTPNAVLTTRDLSLSYGKIRAVDRLNLTVREGEIYGFLGRNGAGKTSTIRMLMGIVRPDGGSISLLEYHGRRIGVKQKQRIGYVSQEQHFYTWMTCSGLGQFVSAFYPTWDHEEFNRLMSVLDLPAKRRISHLSGGMRVKLALAIALAHRPRLLILDEPTSGLDPVARREFLEIIRRQAKSHGRTTFFSSHLIDEVERVADRVGIIHRGQLQYEGDIPTLQASVRRVRRPLTLPAVDESMCEPVVVTPDIARSLFSVFAETQGFRVLGSDLSDADALILYAPPDTWKNHPFSPDQVSQLSLEDIFIGIAGEVGLDV